jgi:hypothetical protein
MAGENPATSDGAKCTGQSHQLPGQQLDQVGVLHRSRLLAARRQCGRAGDPAIRDRAQELAVRDTPKGAMASAQLYSLVETAKANGQEPYAWLRHALERLPTASAVEDYEALLPWNCSPVSHS